MDNIHIFDKLALLGMEPGVVPRAAARIGNWIKDLFPFSQKGFGRAVEAGGMGLESFFAKKNMERNADMVRGAQPMLVTSSYKPMEKGLSNELLDRFGPVKAAKYAFLSFHEEPEFIYKLAKVDETAALLATMESFAKVASKFESIIGNSHCVEGIEDFKTLDHIKTASNAVLSVTDLMMESTFPTLHKNAAARATMLTLGAKSCEKFKKTARMEAKVAPLGDAAFNSFNSKMMGAGALLGLAMLPSVISKVRSHMGKPTAYQEIISADPGLADYPEEDIKKAIDSLYTLSPDLMQDRNTASHLVRQMVMAPPGGISVGYVNDLLRAQETMRPSPLSQPGKLLGTGIGELGDLVGLV